MLRSHIIGGRRKASRCQLYLACKRSHMHGNEQDMQCTLRTTKYWSTFALPWLPWKSNNITHSDCM